MTRPDITSAKKLILGLSFHGLCHFIDQFVIFWVNIVVLSLMLVPAGSAVALALGVPRARRLALDSGGILSHECVRV